MMPLVIDLWPQFAGDATFMANFGNVLVESAYMVRAQKKIIFTLQSVKPLDAALLSRLKTSLEPYFDGFSIFLVSRFAYPNLTEQAVRDLMEELKNDGLPINGFLHGSEIKLKDENVIVTVNKGVKILKQAEFSNVLAKRIGERTGVEPIVELVCTADKNAMALLEKRIEEKAPKLENFTAKQQPSAQTLGIKTLDLEDKPVDVFHGKFFKPKEVTPLKDIGADTGKCVFWGDVFFSEVKGNYRKSYNVSLTDYTGSIVVKLRENTGEDYSKWENLKKGTTLLVRGDCSYDKYERDYVVHPFDVMVIERSPRKDNAKQKRVELHLHTKLSSMDAFCDPGQIVRTAHRMGHRAIAITDHGVCQAYPEALKAADDIHKKDPDFKLIYGCEAYFVDDMLPCVYGEKDIPLTGRFCVFDTETTGLDPSVEYLTEIAAVIVENGEVVDEFQTFAKPPKLVSEKITKITGITNDMLKNAPSETEAMAAFLRFAGNDVLVAHNAHSFDMRFMRIAAQRSELKINNTYIDTLPVSQAMYPGLSSYSQVNLNKHFELPSYGAHRALADSKALAQIFCIMLSDMQENQITNIGDINTGLGGNKEVLKKKYHHLIILVKNQVGLKNLYKLVSESHLKYFFKKPRIPRSVLNKYREGLILTSACEAGELYRAVVEKRPDKDLKRIASYYDVLEVQPYMNNEFMVRNQKVENIDVIKGFNRKIIELGTELNIPVVATGDVHFQEPEDALYRAILQAGSGFKDADNQPPIYYRTTDDMLAQFDYLPKEKAFEIVVTNPNKIADSIDGNLRAIPYGTYAPTIEGSEQELRTNTWQNARNNYGEVLPELVYKRLERELNSICNHGYAVLYVIAEKLVTYSNKNGYQVGSRGSVGSSAVAHFGGISEVNSLEAHYRCPHCKWNEWVTDNSYADGFDLPSKDCPRCGVELVVDGHDIPFETFLGFYGDKEPDIDLNFSGEYQGNVHRYTEELFGKEYVFKAGTISGVQDKTAFGYVKKYLDERSSILHRAEENRLVIGCTGVKRTTGQHPGGMVVVPKGYDIYDFCPIQHPADDVSGGLITTHFEFKYLHDTLLKLDELGHDVPTFYKYFEEYTGVPINSVPMNDPKVISLLISTEALGVTPQQIESETGTFGIPELGTSFVRGMLCKAQPQSFSDLVQISGLSHGTDVWLGNAEDLISDGICTISDVIGCRDSIMIYLIKKGLEPKLAFDVMEKTRKGIVAKFGFPDGAEDKMRECNVPEWYLESCRKIKYMFPKAHAVAYLMAAIRLMWFKVYKPPAFYAVYFTVRGKDIDYEAAIGGTAVAKQQMKIVNERIKRDKEEKKTTTKDEDLLVSLQLENEMMARGYEFLPIELGKSYANKYVLEGEKVRLPFSSLRGVGETAALALEKATIKGQEYLSIEELQQSSGVGMSILEKLSAVGALDGLPESNQLSFI